MWGAVAGAALSSYTQSQSGGGGGAEMSKVDAAMSDRSPINIAPVGVNLGSILQPFNQGAPENGGYGIDRPGAMMPVYGDSQSANLIMGNEKAAQANKQIIIASLALAGLMIIAKKIGVF